MRLPKTLALPCSLLRGEAGRAVAEADSEEAAEEAGSFPGLKIIPF